MGLNDSAQSFLQLMMAEKVLTTDEAIQSYNKCVEKGKGRGASKIHDSDLQSLEQQMRKINSQLEFAEFQIKSMYSPWDKATYWGFCNSIEDEASRVGTHLPKSEVELFFAIMDELRELNGQMELVDAQNVTTQRNASVSENSRVIQKLHQLQWLKIVRVPGEQAFVTPGPRAIIELPKVRQWVRQVSQNMVNDRNAMSVKSQAEVELEEESDDDVPRGRKRRSSQVSPDEMEVDEEAEEVTQSRRGSQPRAVRSGTRRSRR